MIFTVVEQLLKCSLFRNLRAKRKIIDRAKVFNNQIKAGPFSHYLNGLSSETKLKSVSICVPRSLSRSKSW